MEILAPAGGMESVAAAANCGADAVYLGLGALNARRGAQNFDAQSLCEAARYCNERGMAIHLTLNTLLYDEESQQARQIIRAACEAGVAALIVQDLAVVKLARALAPGLALHASTQMSVHSLEGVLQLQKLGFSRAVLARELSLREISAICRESPIEIEVFGHGALCMCLSGQCTLSAMAGGRSGNRGLCAQPCRLPATAGRDEGYALSLKDMTVLTPEKVRALAAAGVCSLKIEGRMKRPEYVAAAVTAARQALAGQTPDETLLRGAFSRSGFTDGYFTGKLTRDMFGIRSKEDVLTQREVLGPLQKLAAHPVGRTPVAMSLTLRAGEPARLCVRDEAGREIQVVGETPQAARTRPTTLEDAQRLLQKLGGTHYTLSRMDADIGEGLMLPAAALNALRREAVEKLGEQRAQLRPLPFLEQAAPDSGLTRYVPREKAAVRVFLSSAGQFSPALAEQCALVALYPGEMEKLLKNPQAAPYLHKFVVRQPPASFESGELKALLDPLYAGGVRRLLVSGLSGVFAGNARGFELHGDFSLNAANTAALEAYGEMGLCDCTVSFELSAGRMAHLGGTLPRGAVVYGRLPLMTMRACPIRHSLGCAQCRGSGGALTDRGHRRFPVSCRSGVSQLYNSDKLYLADKLDSMSAVDFYWLLFTEESAGQVLEVLRSYRDGAPASSMEGLTRGLYFRKVY